MVKIISNKKNKFREDKERKMQKFSVTYYYELDENDEYYDEEDAEAMEETFYAPNNVIALLYIYYDSVFFEYSEEEAYKYWLEDKDEFLEEIKMDFGHIPSKNELRKEFANGGNDLDYILLVKNLSTGEILYKK